MGEQGAMREFRENKKRGTEGFPFEYYRQHIEGYRIKLHWHPEIELLWGIDGEVAVNVSEEIYLLKQGEILFINPEELHSYTPYTPKANYHAAVFDASLFQFQGNHFFEQEFTEAILEGTKRFPRKIDREHEKYQVIQPIVERLFEEDIHSKALVFGDLITLFCTLMEENLLEESECTRPSKRAEDVKLCIKYMEDHYGSKITLAELADLVHMSPNYFCHYFKKQTGISPFTQLNAIRIKQGARLLSATEDAVIRVAEQCGFENVSFFIRKFKEIYGCTPSVYRKKKS